MTFDPRVYNIQFKVDDSLHISLETNRLIIRSIDSEEDEKNCINLFSDPEVMATYDTGFPYEEAEIKKYLEIWKKAWKNHDPFNGYVLLDKKSKEFIGVILLWHSAPGEAEIAYALQKKFWKKGYAKEAVNAVSKFLIPRLMLRGYTLEDKHLKKLVATVRVDNPPASKKILTSVGFKEEGRIYKYDTWNNSFGLFAKSLRNKYQNFFSRLDLRESQKKYAQVINEGVDITAEDMAKLQVHRRVK